MSSDALALPRAIETTGLDGLPVKLTTVAQARDAVAAARLPLARSQYHWLDVYNRLQLAHATANPNHVEEAFVALNLAVAAERVEVPGTALSLAA